MWLQPFHIQEPCCIRAVIFTICSKWGQLNLLASTSYLCIELCTRYPNVENAEAQTPISPRITSTCFQPIMPNWASCVGRGQSGSWKHLHSSTLPPWFNMWSNPIVSFLPSAVNEGLLSWLKLMKLTNFSGLKWYGRQRTFRECMGSRGQGWWIKTQSMNLWIGIWTQASWLQGGHAVHYTAFLQVTYWSTESFPVLNWRPLVHLTLCYQLWPTASVSDRGSYFETECSKTFSKPRLVRSLKGMKVMLSMLVAIDSNAAPAESIRSK